jgi:predicted dinucleotide-binding enzyme
MRIGIIGAGAIGQTVGRLLAASGHEILVSWVSTDARLRNAAERIGPGDPYRHARGRGASRRSGAVRSALRACGEHFSGRIVAAAPEHRGGFEHVDSELVHGLALELAVAARVLVKVLQDVASALRAPGTALSNRSIDLVLLLSQLNDDPQIG